MVKKTANRRRANHRLNQVFAEFRALPATAKKKPAEAGLRVVRGCERLFRRQDHRHLPAFEIGL
jgi:hypothetical protein